MSPRSPPPLRLLLVRHGQSEYNAAVRDPFTWFSPMFWRHAFCPGIRDAALTKLGKEQARIAGVQLGKELSKVQNLNTSSSQKNLDINSSSEIYFVTSPLTRAIQTGVLMMENAFSTSSSSSSNSSEIEPNSSQSSSGLSSEITNLVALPSIRERLQTFADCGRTVEALKKEFSNYTAADFELEGSGEGLPLGTNCRKNAVAAAAAAKGNVSTNAGLNTAQEIGDPEISINQNISNAATNSGPIAQTASGPKKVHVDFSILESDSMANRGLWWMSQNDPHVSESLQQTWRPGFGKTETEERLQIRVRVTKRFLLRRFGNVQVIAPSQNLNYKPDLAESAENLSQNPNNHNSSDSSSENNSAPLVVLFGHSHFWLEFLRPEGRANTWTNLFKEKMGWISPGPIKMRNCHMAYCELDANLKVDKIRYLGGPS